MKSLEFHEQFYYEERVGKYLCKQVYLKFLFCRRVIKSPMFKLYYHKDDNDY